MSSGRFTEKQTAAILRRAAELHSSSDQSSPAHATREELKAAAREVGIEERFVDAAIAEIASPQSGKRGGFWGGPTLLEYEREIEGSFSESDWEDLLPKIRKALDEHGNVDIRGSTFEWTGTGGGAVTSSVVVRNTAHGVRIMANANCAPWMAIFYICALPIWMVLMGLSLKGLSAYSPINFVVAGILTLITFMTTRAILNRNLARVAHALSSLVEGVRGQDPVSEQIGASIMEEQLDSQLHQS